jgi:tRNA (guanine10-N2)-dimethyltransferase
MKLLFEILGDLVDLAREEITGLMEVMDIEYSTFIQDNLLLGIEVEEFDAAALHTLQNRLGLTRTVGALVAGPCETPQLLLGELGEFKLDGKGSFAVRAKRRVGGYQEINGVELAGQVGALVQKASGLRVDLKNPDDILDLFMAERLYLSRRLTQIERSPLQNRRAHFRKHFSPVSLHPKFARACINITRSKNNMLDPFCGTGGFLIEGGLMGLTIYGSDMDPEMVKSSKGNLGQLNIGKHYITKADVGECAKWKENEHYPDGGFDAIVADPPYGRSSNTAGEKIRDIYARAFASLEEIIKPGGYLLLILPEEEDAKLAQGHFENVGIYPQHVHGSLTRHYCLFRNS